MSILKEAIWDEPGIPARSSQPPSIWFRSMSASGWYVTRRIAPHIRSLLYYAWASWSTSAFTVCL